MKNSSLLRQQLVQEIGGLYFYNTYTQEPGIYVRDSSDLYGQFNLASSGVMGAYISHGQLIRAVDGSPFDFLSFYSGKTHCCSEYDRFTMEGLRDGLVVYTARFYQIATSQEPRINQFNWESIDEVRISLSDSSGGYFIMDDIQYSISAPVTIDIKPSKKTENVIGLKKDKNLKVAIVGSATFDALQVDPATVKFGPSAASPVRFKGQDYNHDGFSDLVLTFKLSDPDNGTGILCGDTDATLTGKTSSDPVTNIRGSDSFTVDCS